jgi:formylglycine-generating enzyme required for sulfatase activity
LEHSVTVSAFSLDKYEVTVGRFRRFLKAYDTSNTPPPLDSGAHPNISGTGWQAAWNANMPADSAAFKSSLKCDSSYQTWADEAGNTETYPINCVNWYQAFAFCIWDGGRLPTEAEWEYAAAGGDQNLLYPWGSSPAPACSLANYYDCVGHTTPVGSHVSGKGRWGHLDLAGNVYEWVFDWYLSNWYSSLAAAGTDVANTTPSSARVLRGGGWGGLNTADYLRAAARSFPIPTYRVNHVGFRCAHSP